MRQLCRLVVVDNVIEHTNADALELAIIGGWQCCVKKGEFDVGSIGLYFEIDSMLPLDNEQFAFLAGRNERTHDGKQYTRIKTMKLRKELSQGLLLPVWDSKVVQVLNALNSCWSVQDVVETMNSLIDFDSRYGVVKYEPAVSSAALAGLAKGNFPSFIPKTDQERYQNIRQKYEEAREAEEMFEVTYKLDGSSFTAYAKRDVETNEIITGVCSRNLELKLDQEGNAFVELFHKLGIGERLKNFVETTGHDIAIQGEMVGPNIQNGFEGVPENSLYIFNVFHIGYQEYALPQETRKIVANLGLNYVPVFAERTELPPYEQMEAYVTGKSGLYGKFREGLVFKSTTRDFSFKGISNDYLLKTEG